MHTCNADMGDLSIPKKDRQLRLCPSITHSFLPAAGCVLGSTAAPLLPADAVLKGRGCSRGQPLPAAFRVSTTFLPLRTHCVRHWARPLIICTVGHRVQTPSSSSTAASQVLLPRAQPCTQQTTLRCDIQQQHSRCFVEGHAQLLRTA